jgi:uncharacterized protein YbjT (DUF2867 family)
MNEPRNVLVTGGSGRLGRLVVDRLRSVGQRVRVLTHRAPTADDMVQGDLRDGTGLGAALDGVDAVVHCASDPRASAEVDLTGTRRLVDAALGAGSPHLVYVSIVGVDRIPWRHYRAKYDAERLVAGSGLPWTIQRATQFHPFLATMLEQLARPPVLLVPHSFRFQPVDPADVADRLVQQVASGPAGRAPDFGGPEVLDLTDLARTWLQATGRRRPILPVPVPGSLGKAFRAGRNLCPDHADGRGTWQEFLDSRADGGAAPSVDRGVPGGRRRGE